jgi:hypothetical protein
VILSLGKQPDLSAIVLAQDLNWGREKERENGREKIWRRAMVHCFTDIEWPISILHAPAESFLLHAQPTRVQNRPVNELFYAKGELSADRILMLNVGDPHRHGISNSSH